MKNRKQNRVLLPSHPPHHPWFDKVWLVLILILILLLIVVLKK